MIWKIAFKSKRKSCVVCFSEYEVDSNCLPCDLSCQSCHGPSDQDCTSCAEATHVLDGVCWNQCPLLYYNRPSNHCNRCHERVMFQLYRFVNLLRVKLGHQFQIDLDKSLQHFGKIIINFLKKNNSCGQIVVHLPRTVQLHFPFDASVPPFATWERSSKC